MANLLYLISSMRMLRTFVGVFLLVLWAPVTSHCSWEPLVDSVLFKCAPIAHDEAAETNRDCSDDGDACGTVESGDYKVPNHGPHLPAPTFALVLFTIPLPSEIEAIPAAPEPSPPELPASWRFHQRAAMPVRAPSIA